MIDRLFFSWVAILIGCVLGYLIWEASMPARIFFVAITPLIPLLIWKIWKD